MPDESRTLMPFGAVTTQTDPGRSSIDIRSAMASITRRRRASSDIASGSTSMKS